MPYGTIVVPPYGLITPDDTLNDVTSVTFHYFATCPRSWYHVLTLVRDGIPVIGNDLD